MNKRFESLKNKNNKRVNKVDQKSLDDGELFQDYVQLVLKENGIDISYFKSEVFQREFGEGPSGFEIKLDRRCSGYDDTRSTGRLSVEIDKYYRNSYNKFSWMPSGIFNHAKLKYYIQGNPDVFWIFERELLTAVATLKRNPNEYYFDRKDYFPEKQWFNKMPSVAIERITLNPLRSFLLPIEWCDRFAICKVICENDKVVIENNNDAKANFAKLKSDIKEVQKSIMELF